MHRPRVTAHFHTSVALPVAELVCDFESIPEDAMKFVGTVLLVVLAAVDAFAPQKQSGVGMFFLSAKKTTSAPPPFFIDNEEAVKEAEESRLAEVKCNAKEEQETEIKAKVTREAELKAKREAHSKQRALLTARLEREGRARAFNREEQKVSATNTTIAPFFIDINDNEEELKTPTPLKEDPIAPFFIYITDDEEEVVTPTPLKPTPPKGDPPIAKMMSSILEKPPVLIIGDKVKEKIKKAANTVSETLRKEVVVCTVWAACGKCKTHCALTFMDCHSCFTEPITEWRH
jgi:hypothetical protein